MKKRIGLFVLLFVLVMSMVPVSAFAASSKKYTKVRESQYPKLMQGKLTKKQVESVSAYDGNAVVGKYTVTLKKQKNGRFKLYSIKETWRAKSA